MVDNFLECYHCPVAHKDFCTLVDMSTYKVTTGIYSSHMAEAGKTNNRLLGRRCERARPCGLVPLAQHRAHALPGRGNFMVWRFHPGPGPLL